MTVCSQILVADLLLVWRLSIIWPDNKYNFIVVSLLILAMTGM